MKKNKKITVPETEPDRINLEYLCPAASWGDMTGLIPANNSPETISEAYEELYPYVAPAE
ncbi:MAG: hypothetical protein K2J37_03855 [Ruminococcus sp.]|nr:hypothetical protein [Ruminococcus sp.]